jgi:hypothetical protein
MLVQHLIPCQVSSVAGTLFNLNTHCSTVGFLSDEKDVKGQIMSWVLPVTQPSQFVTSILPSGTLQPALRVRFLSRPPINSNSSSIHLPKPQIHTSMYNYCSLCISRGCLSSPHRTVQKDNSLLCTSTAWYLRSSHCCRFKCCGMLICVIRVSGSWCFEGLWCLHLQQPNGPRRIFSDCLTPKDKGTTFLLHVQNYSPNSVSHPQKIYFNILYNSLFTHPHYHSMLCDLST